MACLCIGGVCIPYSCLVPFLLLSLQWIAAQFAKVGLLPECVAKQLGLNPGGKKHQLDQSCDSGCSVSKSASRRGSYADVSEATIDTTTSDAGKGHMGVEHIDNLKRWEEVFADCKAKDSKLIVKFTADWCKPCKVIQPLYVSLASKYYSKNFFVTLDIDGDECDILSSKLKVAMMPTFVCFKSGAEVGRMSGGNSDDKLIHWISEMCP